MMVCVYIYNMYIKKYNMYIKYGHAPSHDLPSTSSSMIHLQCPFQTGDKANSLSVGDFSSGGWL